MTIYGIHAYITLTNWSQFYITLCYNYCMRNRIRHNYPSLIHCLRAFQYCSSLIYFSVAIITITTKHQKYYFCHCYRYFHTTLLLNTLLQILSLSGLVELTTQLLILENILWLPLCRINKFGLNTLSSKTVAIPYACGLSMSHEESNSN